MTHTISATGYEYFTNEDGSTMAVNLKTERFRALDLNARNE